MIVDEMFGRRLRMEGLQLLGMLDAGSVSCVFFDPQYRGVLDYLSYGNEGKNRGQARSSLEQMGEDVIKRFVMEIGRVLTPSGHLFLWLDKYHLLQGFQVWLEDSDLRVVDMIVWNKQRMGMGYRSRRYCEYLVVCQKLPTRAKGVWKSHSLPDIWEEKVAASRGIHPKPVGLQAALVEAVTDAGDVVVDPAAGSFSVLDVCEMTGRRFLGCDLNG